MTLIGITGFAGSGKDTVAKLIREVYPQTERLAFGDEVKAALARLFNISVEHIESLKRNELHKVSMTGEVDNRIMHELTWRELLQRMGNEVGRTWDEEFWVKQLRPKLSGHIRANAVIVVPDIRYENEAAEIRKRSGSMWHVVRPGYEPSDHASEQGIKREEQDVYLYNSAGIDTLRYQVHTILGAKAPG